MRKADIARYVEQFDRLGTTDDADSLDETIPGGTGNPTDLRRPPAPPHFPKGSWKNRKFPVLLIVGSDCDTVKMTTAWELYQTLKKRDRKVEFVGTGQTGILLSGNGVPIDAVISDFMAGEMEYCLDQLSMATTSIEPFNSVPEDVVTFKDLTA